MTTTLHRRTLGDTVGELGLGCMGMSEFYGRTDDATSIEVIHTALEAGVTLLDTADMYGDGHNEALLGRALARHRDRAFVATKFGIRRDGGRRWNDSSPGYARAACEASLRRLGTDRIDLYYVHRLDGQTPIEETMGALAQLVDEGKVRYLGLSEVSAATLRRAHAVHPITAVQSEFSLWTRNVIDDGVLRTARELGTALVAYSPLGRGFLTGTVRGVEGLDHADFRRANPRFTEENLRANVPLLDAVTRVATQHQATVGQIALAWVLRQGTDIVPIPGTKRLSYLRQNIAATTVALTGDDLALLDDAFTPERIHGQRYPSTTMPDTAPEHEPTR